MPILPSEPRAFLGADAISFSEIGTLARCEQAWVYSYDTEREEQGASKAMQLGTDVHALWGAWHTGQDVTSENETAMWLMRRYAEYYRDDSTRMIDVEVPVAAKLPAGPYFFGWADGLLIHKRELWVAELKTTQTLSNLEHLRETLQTPLYVWALRQMGVPVVGAMIDVIRSYRPVRKELNLSESFARDWKRWDNAHLVRKVAEAMSAVEVRKQLRGQSACTPRVPLRNVGSSCSWCAHAAPCFGLDVTVLPEDDEF